MRLAHRLLIAIPCIPQASATAPGPPIRAWRASSRRRTLVQMNRCRPFVELLGCWAAVFGRPGLLFVVAAGSCCLYRIRPDGLHIAGELPDLLGRHLVPKCGHAMRTAIADRR